MRRRRRIIRRWLREAARTSAAAIAACFEPSIQHDEARLRHARVKREG